MVPGIESMTYQYQKKQNTQRFKNEVPENVCSNQSEQNVTF